jgi:hypothetical protein
MYYSLKIAKRFDVKCSYYEVCEAMHMLILLDVAIPQCVHISEQHIVHDCYVQLVFVKTYFKKRKG